MPGIEWLCRLMDGSARPWLVCLWIGLLCLLATAGALLGATAFVNYYTGG